MALLVVSMHMRPSCLGKYISTRLCCAKYPKYVGEKLTCTSATHYRMCTCFLCLFLGDYKEIRKIMNNKDGRPLLLFFLIIKKNTGYVNDFRLLPGNRQKRDTR